MYVLCGFEVRRDTHIPPSLLELSLAARCFGGYPSVEGNLIYIYRHIDHPFSDLAGTKQTQRGAGDAAWFTTATNGVEGHSGGREGRQIWIRLSVVF